MKMSLGDILETIAFDWKISPEAIAIANHLTLDAQLTPGQIITLPAQLLSETARQITNGLSV